MKLSNTLFSTFLCSMMVFTAPAMAESSVAHTAEYDLVHNVRLIAGHAQSAEQVKKEYDLVFSAYTQAAVSDEGQNDRFVQALVDNHIYSPAQAQVLFASALDSSAKTLAAGTSSEKIAAEMSRLAQTELRGGQFSACGFIGGVSLVGGLGAVVYGAILGHGKTSCMGVSDPNYNTAIGGCNTSGPSASDKQMSKQLYIGGGIGIAAGVILLIAAGSGC